MFSKCKLNRNTLLLFKKINLSHDDLKMIENEGISMSESDIDIDVNIFSKIYDWINKFKI